VAEDPPNVVALDQGSRTPSPRSEGKRRLIVDAAMRAFAEHGYQGARVEDVATELGIAKGSIFQHFGSKAGLFLAAYRTAVESLPAWLDAPAEVRDEGFWAVAAFWLERTEHLIEDDWIPYRVSLVGNYGTDLALRREINGFLLSEDPYGTLEFVEFGIERGDLRADLDPEMAASMLDWLAGGFQDALVTRELDPGLFHRHPNREERQANRIQQFLELLRRAIGAG
jgi:AcrR family transcriptional regulator